MNPATQNRGAYAAIAQDGEVVVDEFDVGTRFRVAVTAFYVADKQDYSTYKIHKLQFRERTGWFLVESIKLNGFQLAQIRKLNSIIASLDLKDTTKARIDLGQVSLDNLVDFLAAENFGEIASKMSDSEGLHSDIFALATKRKSLAEFAALLESDASETVWQGFLERNPWIFGFGLNYVFLDRVSDKFEATTTGSDVFTPGKRADGLAMIRAQVSQTVLIEIKSGKSRLLQDKPYRKGVWPVDNEVSAAVSQSQKTCFEFSRRNAVRLNLTDDLGNETGNSLYTVEPRAYLIVGNLSELMGNNDKIASFELFRRKLTSPEILTFDELYYRAVALVDGISNRDG